MRVENLEISPSLSVEKEFSGLAGVVETNLENEWRGSGK